MENEFSLLLQHLVDYNKTRLLVATLKYGADWLNAIQVKSFGLNLNDDAASIVIGFHRDKKDFQFHSCNC